MPKAGDRFIVQLSKTHLKWGTFRFTASREPIYGETYIPIPLNEARRCNIFNSNKCIIDTLGVNIYNYSAYINNTIFSKGVLKSSGCSTAGDIYAKNLSGNNNLKMLSPWIYHAGISVGDYVEVLFISPSEIEIRKL